MTKEERAEIKRQEEIEKILGRFIGDSDLHESCQALLDCLGIKYTAISPATLPPEAFFDKKFVDKNTALIDKIDSISVAGIATQDTFLVDERLTISREEMEAQLENDHYKEMAFFSLDVNASLTRTEIALITRAFNRRMHYRPVVLFIRFGNLLSMATCERSKYVQKGHEGEKVGKVTILRNIDCSHPHHGHVVILGSLDISSCESSFDAVYEHWIKTFSSELLTKKFYQELSDWFFWAVKNVRYPNDLDDPNDDDKYNHENVIRLVTRLIFVWFLKEKHLIPEEFFDESYIRENLIQDFNPNEVVDLFYKSSESKYYKAILQNLFFATLNCPIVDPQTGKANNRHFGTSSADDSNSKVMKYKGYFTDPDLFVELVNTKVPFLNGGLFDCLDDSPKHLYYDGFSEKEEVSKALVIPDYLFFGEEVGKNIDLSDFYGDKNKKKVSARGIIDILKRFNFTIEENTPFDQEVSLDPELLGKVFENLLASYNPETKTTARKQTGSFYTPRDIVQYMVDESIVEHLKRTVDSTKEQLFRDLVSYSTGDLEISEEEKDSIMKSIYNCKILDPACGSGAFPVGMLQQMVHILSRIDPNNKKWEELIIDSATVASREAFMTESKQEREEKLADIYSTFDEELNFPDYARKLYIIENCIHGVDIQPIAIQISHLRFFISLIVDQKENSDPLKNFGIRPLPNLEAKFVAANSLIPLNKSSNLFTSTPKYVELEKRLQEANHRIFTAKSPQQKAAWKKNLKVRRQEMADMLVEEEYVDSLAGSQIASWDMFNQNSHASFFDSEWMFGIQEGFDIVIGNPPYVVTKKGSIKGYNWDTDLYKMFLEASFKRFIKKEGILSFITPKFYLLNKEDKNIRDYLMEKADIVLLALCNPFEAVTENVITIAKNTAASSDSIENYKYSSEKGLFESKPLVLKSDCYNNGYHEIILGNDSSIQNLLQKYVSNCLFLKDISSSKRGAEVSKNYLRSKTSGMKALIGGDMKRYTIMWNETYLDAGNKEYRRLHDFFSTDLILLRRVDKCLDATISQSGVFAFNKNVYGIKVNESKGFSKNVVLGWLNSKAVDFYYKKKFSTKKEDAFPEIQAYLYEQLPIPVLLKERHDIIEQLVQSALDARKDDFDSDITSIEESINLQIYLAYKFDFADVLTIDPDFRMSKEEYASLISE